MTTCRRCGTGLLDEAAFCHRCGASTDTATTVLDLGGIEPGVAESASPRRRRWLPVAAVAALIAVVGLGVMASIEDDTEPDAAPRPSTTTTSAPARSTTSVPPGELLELPPVQPMVLGRETGMSLVLGNGRRALMTVDLDTGAVSTLELGETVNFVVGLGDRALAVSGTDGTAWWVRRSGLGPLVMDLQSSGELLGGGFYPADGESFWLVRSDSSSGASYAIERLAYDGSGVVESFDVRSDVFLRAVSPDGTVVAGGFGGGTYAIGRDGDARRVSPGFPIAVNATMVLTVECSDSLACETVVRDLATGELISLVNTAALDLRFGQTELAPGGESMVLQSFAGTRERRLVRLVEPVGECQLVDTDLSGTTGLSRFAPDGSFVVEARPGSGGAATILTFTATATCDQFELEVPFRNSLTVGLAVIESAGLDG